MTDTVELDDQQRTFEEQQRSGIGSTDSPKILGLSKYGTALTVYNRIVSGEPPREPSLPAWLGLKLQRTVGELYTAATGYRVRADNGHHKHPTYPFIVTHLDYRVWGDRRHLVEAKTRAYSKGWGEDGSQEIPEDVWVQVQHEMMVTDALRCDVAVLIGHHTFRVYPIARDEEFMERLTARLVDFWESHILAGVPPLPTGHAMDTEVVRDRWPEVTEPLRAATPEQEKLAQQLRWFRAGVKNMQRDEAEVANRIKDSIGDALGIEGPFGRITWALTRGTTDWKSVAVQFSHVIDGLMELAAPDPQLELLRMQRDSAIEAATRPGVRRLDIRFTEEESDE